MTRLVIAALTALALWSCGGLDESEGQVGIAVQALASTEQPPPPPVEGTQRLSTEDLFSDTSGVITSPQDRKFADVNHYQVDVQPSRPPPPPPSH